MSALSIKLSAYLDGQLPVEEARKLEEQLEASAALQAELEELMSADMLAKSQFDAQLSEPVPLSLAQIIQNSTLETTSLKVTKIERQSRFGNFQSIAASVALLCAGVVGGYFVRDYIPSTNAPNMQVSAEQNWINEIANYHAIYAKQKRHLVEVKDTGDNHIDAWLSKSLGHNFNVPDLSASGLNFEGARLLVVSGKPVAQLIYTTPNGEIVALCVQKSTRSLSAGTKTPAPINDSINGFDFFYWEHNGSDLVLVGDKGFKDFDPLAVSTNNQI